MTLTLILVLHVLLAMGLIAMVLIQHGKGADAGAAFGSGASATVFGAKGSGSFLTRLTAILAASFFATSFLLAYMGKQAPKQTDLMKGLAAPAVEEVMPNVVDPAPAGQNGSQADSAVPAPAGESAASGGASMAPPPAASDSQPAPSGESMAPAPAAADDAAPLPAQ